MVKIHLAGARELLVPELNSWRLQLFAIEGNYLRKLVDAEHLQGDVIGTAAIFSEVDKRPTSGIWRLRSQDLFDLITLHLAPQPVSADHQDIVSLERQWAWQSVDFNFFAWNA